MQSISAIIANIEFLYREDLDGPPRVVRSLVSHQDLPKKTWLLPINGDTEHISGLLLEEDQIDWEQWKPLEPPVRWRRGAVPVALIEDRDQRVLFQTEAELEGDRERRLAKVVLAALSRANRPSMALVADLEHADDLAGAHPVTTAALLSLAEQNPGEPAIGDPVKLRRRFHTAAPDGMVALQRCLTRPAFAELRRSHAADSLTGAAMRAATPNGILNPDAWAVCRERTLWSWWLHNTAASRGKPLRMLAVDLKIEPDVLMLLAHGDASPSEVGVETVLPSRAAALGELNAEFVRTPPQRERVGLALKAHRNRISLFTRQLGELQRALGDGGLTRWAEFRRTLMTVKGWLTTRHSEPPWKNAMLSAEILREEMRVSEPTVDLGRIVSEPGIHLASATLPYAGQQGAVHGEPDTAPVLFLTPQVLSRSIGVIRFAVLHQLGHLVQGASGACAKLVEEEDAQTDDPAETSQHEAFANAFAAYFAAPKSAVLRLVTAPVVPDSRWLQGAARDVSLSFGLSAAAAVPHVLNCCGLDVRPWQARLRGPEWTDWARTVEQLVADQWRTDRDFVERQCGTDLRQAVELALQRPNSTEYASLVRRSVDRGMLDQDLEQAYGLSGPRAPEWMLDVLWQD